uniref:rRNA N-glycosylase n=1 Tax=Vernicia fordii TaxID=73154 RepID=A0A4D6U1T4_VERFO|nr:RIP3 [Vernicia fordii]
MKTNMKSWIMVATWFCWAILFGFVNSVYPEITAENKYPLGFPTVSFTTTTSSATPESYSEFLKALRNQLASGTLSYSIPLLLEESKVSNAQRFVLVTLSNSEASTTLAVDVVNVYVVGYRVGDNSYFFNDTSNQAFSDLFQNTLKTRFKFNGSYPALKTLGADRENVDLGIFSLDQAVFSLNKYSSQPNQIAAPLVVVIQMVSEAARFTHIERKIKTNFFIRFRPLGDVLSLENKWSKLSSAIQGSNAGVFKETVQLQKSDYTPFYVSKVEEIKPYIGLLLFDTETSLGQAIGSFIEDFIQKWQSLF